MREIKFRGRDGQGYWQYGDYLNWEIGIPQIRVCRGPYYETFGVDRETVGQFTGLLDRNGEEIYEGDILRDPDGEILKVVWNNGASSWECAGQLHHFLFIMRYMDLMQVIGNVHDNPDLLEKQS